MTATIPLIHDDWKNYLSDLLNGDLLAKIVAEVNKEIESGQTVYPPFNEIFNAFNFTRLSDLKVVIIGQDPYHGAGQAHGLCFSVQDGVQPPPSLVNIYKEINADLGLPIPATGNLTRWAEQGVLLLNAVLSVRAGQAGSHASLGWEQFTNEIIKKLSAEKEGLVFLLWGKFAISKEILIDDTRHFVLTAPHPSPFSANSGFFGCKHFSKANEILKAIGQKPVDWGL